MLVDAIHPTSCHAGLTRHLYFSLAFCMVRLIKYYVYIMSNNNLTVYYVGVTSNIMSRVQAHKNGESNFTNRYNCHLLLYYEEFVRIKTAIAREKQLNKCRHAWKEQLIKK